MKKITLFAVLGLCLAACMVTAETARPRVVILILDKITLADLSGDDLPNFGWAIRRGGMALMNTRTEGNVATEHAYITLGAGSRGVGTPDSGAAYAAGDPLENGTAAEVYRRNTGRQARPGNLLLPTVAGIMSLNAVLDHPVIPGTLGRTIRQAGLTTCVIGNGDLPDQPGRHAVSLVMDDLGLVDEGAIGADLLQADPGSPFGIRTDQDALLRAYDRLASRSTLVAIDLGDTGRLDAYAPYLTPERQRVLRHEAISRADFFLGELRRRLDPVETLLLILSPSPGTLAQEIGNPMTPIVAVGPGFKPGRLTSATTKRPGIVTNMDVAPTILTFLGLRNPPEIAGRPLKSPGEQWSMVRLMDLDSRVTAIAQWQQPVMKVFNIILDIVFILCLIFLLWRGLPGARLLQSLLLFVAVIPLALLLLPLFAQPATFPFYLIGLPAVLTAVLMATSRRGLLPLSLLLMGTIGLIVVDQLLGAPLARYSLLSYSPITGARFYGIGNEYMGVLIGTATMAAGLAFTRWPGRRWLLPGVVLAFLVLTYIMGAPNLGTNIGGTMAAVVGFGITALALGGRKISPRKILLIGGVTLGTVLLLALADSLRDPGIQTHLGRLVRQIGDGGVSPLWQLIGRKMAMNLKLIRFSGWSRVVLFALASIFTTALIPAGRREAFAARYPCVARAIWSSLAGAAAACLFNDSGIVSAGTLLIFPAVTWLYLLLGDEAEHGRLPRRNLMAGD